MASITPAMVRELRERTGAGMMDCKNALNETGGSVENAVDWLRKKGLAAAAKKAGRTAAEGLVGVCTKGTAGAVVEVNSETDFVARNEAFQKFVSTVTELAGEAGGNISALQEAAYPGKGHNVAEELTNLVTSIGENMLLRRSAALSVSRGVVVDYIHNVANPGLGRIGVLVALESSGDTEKLGELGKQVAMHVAAAHPQSCSIEELDPNIVERELTLQREQAAASGKPPEVVEKMVEGRMRKFYEQVVLMEQIFVIDGERKVRQVVEDAAKDIGAPVELKGFVLFALGEGIEKKETDFAAEVAATLGK